jgi:hypothetical protein
MTKLYTKTENAVAAGYAEFNRVPTLAVDVPDGGFTISAKTSEGKRITFSFMPYRNGGPPQCVDVCYHDGGDEPNVNKEITPHFDVIGFGGGPNRKTGTLWDTRAMTKAAGESQRAAIACILMNNGKETT